MKELRKKIEAEVLGITDWTVKTDEGDLLVNTVGTKLVHVYNIHKQKNEQYKLKEFARFLFGEDWKVDIFEELLIEAKRFFESCTERGEDKNLIANSALRKADLHYGLNGAGFEDSWAWEKARDLVL